MIMGKHGVKGSVPCDHRVKAATFVITSGPCVFVNVFTQVDFIN